MRASVVGAREIGLSVICLITAARCSLFRLISSDWLMKLIYIRASKILYIYLDTVYGIDVRCWDFISDGKHL